MLTLTAQNDVPTTERWEIMVQGPQHPPHLFVCLFILSHTSFKDEKTDAQRGEALAYAILLITRRARINPK